MRTPSKHHMAIQALSSLENIPNQGPVYFTAFTIVTKTLIVFPWRKDFWLTIRHLRQKIHGSHGSAQQFS